MLKTQKRPKKKVKKRKVDSDKVPSYNLIGHPLVVWHHLALSITEKSDDAKI